jgi:hypothetical protein
MIIHEERESSVWQSIRYSYELQNYKENEYGLYLDLLIILY